MRQSSEQSAALEDWHARSAQEVVEALAGDADAGLTPDEAQRRLEQYGPNELETGGGPNPLRILLRQFGEILVIVLMVAAIVSFAIGERIDSIVIMAIVVLNAVLGFVQEYRAEQAVEALRRMASPTARM